jgi:hypothetical protein
MPVASAGLAKMARQGASVTTKPLWRPSVEQLCTIAELSHAKAPIEAIAKAVKLSPRAFKTWQARLKTAAAAEAAKPAQAAPVEPPKPELTPAERFDALFN